MSSVPGQQRKPPRSKAKMQGEKSTEVITLPSIVANTKKPNGRPRKIYTLEEEMDAWLAANDGTAEIHDALRVGFEVSVPRWFVALSKKADSGDPVALKLALEWWGKWKTEDVARTLNVTPSSKSSAAWVSASVDPDGTLGIAPQVESVATTTSGGETPDNSASEGGSTEAIDSTTGK